MNRRNVLKLGLGYASGALGLPFFSSCGGGGDDGTGPSPNVPTNCRAGSFAKGLNFASAQALSLIPPINKLEVSTAGLPSSWDNADSFTLAREGYITPLPPIGDQGHLGSCVAWGVGYAMGTSVSALSKRGQAGELNIAVNIASPADLYSKLLLREGSSCGNGTLVQDALDILVKEGVVSYAQSPYIDQICTAPSSGGQFRLDSYKKIDVKDVSTINSMRIAIVNQKILPIGMAVYPDFEKLFGPNAVYIHPANDQSCPLGGHCIVVTGYDDNLNAFRVMNSWGTSNWGDKGFGWIAYETFLRVVSEVYAPDIVQTSNPLLPFPNGLIPTASSQSNGVSVTFARSHNIFNTLYPVPNVMNTSFKLSDAIHLDSYAIFYVDDDPAKSINLGQANVNQWVLGSTFSVDLPDQNILFNQLKNGNTVAIVLGGSTKTGAPIQLTAYMKMQTYLR
jgi:hypothetical protein